jgi:HK97 family phage portal protein
MALWDQVTSFLALHAFQDSTPLQKRSGGSVEDLLARLTSTGTVHPWKPASIREALGVPAIYRAVSMIANTMGALSMDAYRNGVKLAPDDRPRIIVRPDPFRIPREFFNQTGWNMATRGEAWWWVASRDLDDMPLSLLSIPPAEVNVTENPRDLRYPVIEWRGVQMRNKDMLQIVLNREPGGLRGVGPLQLCGAAVSVSVEAQEWAADFFSSGGVPSTLIKSAVALTEDEAIALKAQWVGVPNNVPRIIDPTIEEVTDHEVDVASKSMFEAREYQNAEAARMFGIPATLLETSVAGSSLTYQNLETEFGKFVRGCLWPNYLEPVEQTMSDQLSRSTVSRFNVDALLRADIKTRYEVYKLGVADSGVLSVDEAREQEGLDPGDVEMAAMPFAPPQAVPSLLPIQGRSEDDGPVRCLSCGKTRFVIESREPLRMRCIRCRSLAA